MGVVLEAEQAPIGRRVAVKLLPWKSSGGSRWRERFHHEARIAARLQHPHIVPVYSFGEHEGMAYYVMQLVEGVGLNRLIERLRGPAGVVTKQDIRAEFSRGGRVAVSPAGPLSGPQGVLRRGAWPQIIKITLQVADALRYAHRQGTLHRDIKPANLLIDVRGTVSVADFGLARLTDDGGGDTEARISGTLRYMAPEQFEGRADERTDLYSLGISLYELCTLRPAYDAADAKELVDQICRTGPVPPRKANPDVPKRLEALILRAIERNAERRYQSADEMLADLRRFLHSRWRLPFSWFR
jgi:serine/threonine protein kinase